MLSPVRFLTHPTARQRAATFAAIASAAVLAASVADAAERGACLSMTQTSSRTANDVDKMVANFGVEAQLFSAAQCGVDQFGPRKHPPRLAYERLEQTEFAGR